MEMPKRNRALFALCIVGAAVWSVTMAGAAAVLGLYVTYALAVTMAGSATIATALFLSLGLSIMVGLTAAVCGATRLTGLRRPEEPLPAWLGTLWRAAFGALLGALPSAIAADLTCLAPFRDYTYGPLVPDAAFAAAMCPVGLGAVMGAALALARTRFRVGRAREIGGKL